MYQPTTNLLNQFVKLCNAKNVQDAIPHETSVRMVDHLSLRWRLASYVKNGNGGDTQLEAELADYKAGLEAFQKAARQVAEKKPLSFTSRELSKLNGLLTFEMPTPKFALDSSIEGIRTFEVSYLYRFIPKGVKFPVLSASALLLCYIVDKLVPYHLTVCEGVKAIRCGKILLRKRRQKSGVKALCRSHQTYKAKRKKRRG